jgi:hypothetical protein
MSRAVKCPFESRYRFKTFVFRFDYFVEANRMLVLKQQRQFAVKKILALEWSIFLEFVEIRGISQSQGCLCWSVSSVISDCKLYVIPWYKYPVSHAGF